MKKTTKILITAAFILLGIVLLIPILKSQNKAGQMGQAKTKSSSSENFAHDVETPISSHDPSDSATATDSDLGKVISALASDAAPEKSSDNAAADLKQGWQRIDNQLYYFTENGEPAKSWFEVDNETYFADPNGKVLSGLQEIEGSIYYFDPQEYPKLIKNRRIRLDDHDFYFDETGKGKKYQILDPENVQDGIYLTDKNFELLIKGGIASIEGIRIVNKTFSVPGDIADGLSEDLLRAFSEMKADIQKEGMDLNIITGYRTFADQRYLYENYKKTSGEKQTDFYSARPGYSEHQLGETIDIGAGGSATALNFGMFEESDWVSKNCYKYGFIVRYPEDGEEITGYKYEPWHLRYVGKDLAPNFFRDGKWITIEEYYGIPSHYAESVLKDSN